ncbi:hypothetical protein PISL3812_09856 [Talaromyces islandicus]|uniref:Uncharacterized protein n=1 Tax=Talaromyces islandicus TaxID=28573 RepID=A0A0U1MB82_TALIS|nr:hypothetical protein PISL3812_09856 [Talaromyces islandicus]
MLEPSKIACSLDDLYSSLGHNHHFDSIVLKMVVEILTVRLSFRGLKPEDEEVDTAEGITTEEPTYKDGSPTGSPTAEVPANEDAPPVEPAWEEDAHPAELEEYFHHVNESAHEDAPGVQGPSYKEEGLPIEETAFAEDAHQVEVPPAGGCSSEAEELSINGSNEVVQAHLVRVSVMDFVSYKSWGKLSLDRKAKRAKKLTAKGLPIPSEDGWVSIFVAGVRT